MVSPLTRRLRVWEVARPPLSGRFPATAAFGDCSGTDSLFIIRIGGILMKRCKVAYHELVMPFKVDLDPAHGPNRAQNRCRDVRPNRVVEIYDNPVMKPCTHAFPPISCALPLGPCGPPSAATVGYGGGCLPKLTEQPQPMQIHPASVTKTQPAGWLVARAGPRGVPSGPNVHAPRCPSSSCGCAERER